MKDLDWGNLDFIFNDLAKTKESKLDNFYMDELCSDSKELIYKDVERLFTLYDNDGTFLDAVEELGKAKNWSEYLENLFVALEYLVSISYFRLDDNLEEVIKIYRRFIVYEIEYNNTKRKGKSKVVLSLSRLDELIEVMFEDYDYKRKFIDKCSIAFNVDLKQKYILKLDKIDKKIMHIQKALLAGIEVNNEIDLEEEEYNELLLMMDDISYRIKNSFEVNWKKIVLEKKYIDS